MIVPLLIKSPNRIEQSLTNFYHNKSVKDGLHGECNTCKHEYYTKK
jgi:hypothetical protein